MKNKISSAGLLYIYLNGYKEDDMLCSCQIDTYSYIEDGFLHNVKECTDLLEKRKDAAHVFAVVGIKDRAESVYAVIENILKENYQNILNGQSIQKSSKKLDKTGNAFCRCVQEFFCEQSNGFPRKIAIDCEEFVIIGISCEDLSAESKEEVVSATLVQWIEKEAPCLLGKQLMIRSFFLKDLLGRKVVMMLPDPLGGWNLIFEGGHRILLGEDFSYSKETLSPLSASGFGSSNTQSILLNPIYAYGKWFQPNDICEEWHKAFLYLCAISKMVWTRAKITKTYESFLELLEENICVTMNAPPIISKENYYDALLEHIRKFRGFLKGKDEPVISKDLHQTMNTRYVYLPYLRSLVTQTATVSKFSGAVL